MKIGIATPGHWLICIAYCNESGTESESGHKHRVGKAWPKLALKGETRYLSELLHKFLVWLREKKGFGASTRNAQRLAKYSALYQMPAGPQVFESFSACECLDLILSLAS